MWSLSVEVLNPYKAIMASVEKEERICPTTLWEKIKAKFNRK